MQLQYCKQLAALNGYSLISLCVSNNVIPRKLKPIKLRRHTHIEYANMIIWFTTHYYSCMTVINRLVQMQLQI